MEKLSFIYSWQLDTSKYQAHNNEIIASPISPNIPTQFADDLDDPPLKKIIIRDLRYSNI